MIRTFPSLIRKTIFYGLIWGLAFIPICVTLNLALDASYAIGLALWLCVAGDAILMSRWSNSSLSSLTFPLMLLFLAIFLVKSVTAFWLLALLVIGWIRSGICFQTSPASRLGVEVVLIITGCFLAGAFTFGSTLAASLGVWMFFLMQALYFVIFEDGSNLTADTLQPERFEQARTLAEDILSARLEP
jgi:hypothetical protein